MSTNRTILYLRTDIGTQHLTGGGSVTHTLGVIKSLRELGYTVVVASSAMHTVLAGEPGVIFSPLKFPNIGGKLPYKIKCFISSIFFTWSCIKLVRMHKPQFLYQRSSCLNVTGALLSMWYNIPLIIEFNGPEAWADKHWGPQRFWRLTWIIAWCERISFRRAQVIVVVSEPLKEYVCAQGIKKEKILVNPNGVDTVRYNPALLHREAADIREKYGLENAFVFGFIGTFGAWHGTHMFAELIPAVCSRFPHVRFLLIGQGPELPALKQKLQAYAPAVTCTGAVEYAQARHYLAACDAFICPTQPNPDGSRFFGSPTKLFEYLSMGKPVIASALEQISEIIQPAVVIEKKNSVFTIQDNEIGFLVEPTCVHSFIQAACAIVAMPDAQKSSMGLRARRAAQERYSWLTHTQRIMNFFNRRA